MKSVLPAIAASCWALIFAPAALAQSAPEAVARESPPTVPIERLIATVAKKTGKTFVVDPRVRAEVVIIGKSVPDLSYEQLQAVLEVYGFIALEDAGLVRVVPDTLMKTTPTPIVTPKDVRPASEIVTAIISVKNVSAAQIVPILRPMVPTVGTLVAFMQTNSLIIVDNFANVRRIEQIVRALDNTPTRATPAAPATSGDNEH